MENTSFDGFSAGPHCKNTQQLFEEFRTLAEMAARLAGLEVAGLPYLMHFAGESPDSPHSNLAVILLSIASGSIYPQNVCLIPPSLRKIKVKLNRCLANSPAHFKHYFSGPK
jgi:hypothetical protein